MRGKYHRLQTRVMARRSSSDALLAAGFEQGGRRSIPRTDGGGGRLSSGILKADDSDRSQAHLRDPPDAAATSRKSDPPVLRARLPTIPFGTGDRRGIRSFFPGDRRYPGYRGEEAGA